MENISNPTLRWTEKSFDGSGRVLFFIFLFFYVALLRCIDSIFVSRGENMAAKPEYYRIRNKRKKKTSSRIYQLLYRNYFIKCFVFRLFADCKVLIFKGTKRKTISLFSLTHSHQQHLIHLYNHFVKPKSLNNFHSS